MDWGCLIAEAVSLITLTGLLTISARERAVTYAQLLVRHTHTWWHHLPPHICPSRA
jgi:hypothetical protein